jgi:hypothetical protein
MSTCGILSTPVELHSYILRQLPMIEGVLSAIQSSRSLYEALQEDNAIVAYVLHKQIDSKLLPYAAAFFELDRAPRI